MSLGPQPWYEPPKRDDPAAGERPPPEPGQDVGSEAARLAVGLRLGLRIAAVWLLYALSAALVPAAYGTLVAGPVSLGVILAAVPLAVGVHALVGYGRRLDRLGSGPDARRWS
ncbi:hypothetical protein ACN6LC_000538 [Streptomyces violaceoruber]|uniref:Uncharacterized protein n=5 Tax=Streptomyces TaxID=1883 RepID=A0A7U9DPW1_STRLI|nr:MULTISPECIES: hypothetical protein [Streptomyces]QSJ13929.1 integral membrane protein [Streptomyces lividans]BDD69502.1 hypothetical protein JCM4020_01220 [Streptomyces coelicolor]AIJ18305.1 integral membrane protein [Streptomyces lividans TK24]EFD71817.1 integral membrane protein [Streptomyces lividans TK24]EOY44798.1 hypothetical protein SLI_0079 [Streptomyces lividans 1326]